MNRLIIAFCIFFSSASFAQQPFHWELTNGPGTDVIWALAVNSNGDIIAGSSNAIVRFSAQDKRWMAFPNSNFGELSNHSDMTTLPDGRIVILNSSQLYRFEADGTSTTLLPLSNAQSIIADHAGNLFAIVGPSYIGSTQQTGDSILARSTNDGDSWQMLPSPASESLNYFSTDEKNYYLATNSGIYISSDSGMTWKRFINDLPTGQYLTVIPGDTGFLWSLEWTPDHGVSVFRSADFGESWKLIQHPSDYLLVSRLIVLHDKEALLYNMGELALLKDTIITNLSDQFWDYGFWVGETNYNVAVVDSNSLWLATPGEKQSSDLPWVGYISNLFSSSGSAPLVWNPMSAPLSTPSRLTEGFNSIFATVTGSGSYLVDASNNWKYKCNTSVIPLEMDYYDNSLLGSTIAGGLERSTDSGISWTNIFPSSPGAMTYAAAATASVIYAGSHGVFKTTNAGLTWNETNDGILTSTITALTIDTLGTLYAGTANGLFISSDGGNSWRNNSGVGTSQINFISANRSGTVAASNLSGTVFRSNNQGALWQSVNIPNGTGLVLTDSGDVFASSSTGVYYWPSDSAQTYNVSDSLQGRGVTALAMNSSGTLYAAVGGLGVWKVVSDHPFLSVLMPLAVHNAVASPNPASSSVRIILPSPGDWSVIAMDALGREHFMPYFFTNNMLQCDVSKFPSGAYEILLRSGATQIVSRVQVVR